MFKVTKKYCTHSSGCNEEAQHVIQTSVYLKEFFCEKHWKDRTICCKCGKPSKYVVYRGVNATYKIDGDREKLNHVSSGANGKYYCEEHIW